MARDLFNLPLERLKRYRQVATEAEAFATTMITAGLRDGNLTIARRWRELASEVEKSMHSEKGETSEGRLPVQSAKPSKRLRRL
jgi:adenine-specific DNA methylase